MYQCGPSDCHKRTTLVREADNEGGFVSGWCGGREYMGTLHFLLSFALILKSTLKRKSIFFLNGGKKASMGNGKFRWEAARCFCYFLSGE